MKGFSHGNGAYGFLAVSPPFSFRRAEFDSGRSLGDRISVRNSDPFSHREIFEESAGVRRFETSFEKTSRSPLFRSVPSGILGSAVEVDFSELAFFHELPDRRLVFHVRLFRGGKHEIDVSGLSFACEYPGYGAREFLFEQIPYGRETLEFFNVGSVLDLYEKVPCRDGLFVVMQDFRFRRISKPFEDFVPVFLRNVDVRPFQGT